MTRHRLFALSVFVGMLLALGCTQPLLTSGPSVNTSTSEATANHGTLRIQIKWPSRDLPGFSAQVIPLRTNSLRLTTRDGQGRLLDQRLITRLPGPTPVATESIRLPASTGYRFLAEAFEEAAPTSASRPISVGNATNLTIRKGRITAVPITLTAVDAPTIESIWPASGPYETPFTIWGTHFGATRQHPFSVSIGGVTIPALRRDDTRIDATASTGITTGNVVVMVDGVPSSTIALYTVTQGLDTTVVALEDSYGDNGVDVALQPAPTPSPTPDPIERYGDNGLDVSVGSTDTDQGLDLTLE